MPYFENRHVKIYYEEMGEGEPIIANHGLTENTLYWTATGVAQKLAEHYRVIMMDMRGHGNTTIPHGPYGYDISTMGNDFGALADHLGIDKFHMLTHATGGMNGCRYAMTTSSRLLSCMLTDTGSESQPEMPTPEGYVQPSTEEILAGQAMHIEHAGTVTPEQRRESMRANPGPFLFKLAEHPEAERMFKICDEIFGRGDPVAQAHFMQTYYCDPNPMVEGLRQITCPTLVLLGEFDIVFIKPSEIMAKEIPDNRHVIIPDIGHMTAIENPEVTIKELLDFLACVKETGKANR